MASIKTLQECTNVALRRRNGVSVLMSQGMYQCPPDWVLLDGFFRETSRLQWRPEVGLGWVAQGVDADRSRSTGGRLWVQSSETLSDVWRYSWAFLKRHRNYNKTCNKAYNKKLKIIAATTNSFNIKHKTSHARLAQLLQPSLAFCFS